MALNDVVKERQATPFTAERAFADTCEVTISIKLHTIEYGHHTDVLHTTILHDGIEDYLAVGINILEFMPRNVLQESRDREDGTGTEPTAHMVARHMVEHRVTGNLEDIVLQFLQCTDTRHLLLGCRVTENEVTKAHVLLDKLMQIDVKFGGVLVDEIKALRLSLLAVGYLRGVKDQRYIFVATANLPKELQTGLGIAFLDMRETSWHGLHREASIGNDTKGIVVILIIYLHRLLVVGSEHHLWTSTLSLSCSMGIKGLCREPLRLGKDVIIEIRQHGRIETDVVFHKQDHLHTSLLDVVFDIHLILKQLDNRHNEVGIAQPAEHVVED